MQRQFPVSFEASVTSRAPVGRGYSTGLYHVYVAMGRDCDYICGQNAGMSESMNAFAHATAKRVGVSGSQVQSRVKAIEKITRQRLVDISSTSEWDVDARRVT